jgi:hypothetical protein
VSYHYQNPTQHVGLVQSRPYHHLIENYFVLDDIAEKFICDVRQQSLKHSLKWYRWMAGLFYGV